MTPETPPQPPPSAPDQLSLTTDERTWAMAAHAVTFVEGGILGPLGYQLPIVGTWAYKRHHPELPG